MKQFLTFLFNIGYCMVVGQVDQGTITYNGRVTHMHVEDADRIEIPYEQQNTNGVSASIYFDSSNHKVDLLATIVYSLNVTHQKEEGWVLYLERFGSDKVVETTVYDHINTFVFEDVHLNYDTTRIIAGYPCHLAKYTLGEITYELWFSKDFHLGSNLLPVPDEIPGACLEFTIYTGIADVKYTANAVDLNSPHPDRFKMIIPDGYVLSGEPLFPVEQTASQKSEKKHTNSQIPPPPPVFEKD